MEKGTVLIVDDEFGLADVVADLLREAEYDVAIAINGRLGLTSLQTRRADIVLVDMMMPVMDGPEMVRLMRTDPALATIPVILMTALPEAMPSADEAPVNAMLTKPFTFADLLATIERLLPA